MSTSAVPDEPADGEPRRRRRWPLLLLVVVALWSVGAATLVVLGGLSARSGAEQVRGVELSASLRELLDGELDRDLEAAHGDFDRADRLLNNPLLAPARLVPVAGRQLRSAGAMARSSSEVLGASVRAATVLRRELDDGAPTGSDRLGAVERLRDELQEVHEALRTVDLGPSEALVAPLDDARRELDEKLVDARTRTADVVVVLDALHRLLDGPSRYLVLAANNAEMRVGSGMFLSIGQVEVADGGLEVTADFEPTGDLLLDEPLDLPPEMAQLWGWSAMGSDYRSLGLSARFPVNAPLAAEHWRALGRGDVDGVLAIDVVALRALLRVVGPVELDDRSVGPDDVFDFVLRDQYAEADDDDVNEERRERLGELATAVLDRLDSAAVDLGDLVEELRQAREGRHLLFWAADDTMQDTWLRLGLDGELDADSVLIGLANVDASKLDPFIEVDVDVQTTTQGERVVHELEIRIRNSAPGGMGRYVEGTDESPAYRGLLVAHLPERSEDVAIDGLDGLSATGRDGPTVVVAAPVTVDQAGERIGRLRFSLPATSSASVLPSARVPPPRWTIGAQARQDDSGLEL